MRMGSYNSKVEVTVPPTPTCFPMYDNEEEFEESMSSNIEECYLQATTVSSWILSTMFPSYSQATFTFTAATYLLTFIIHRLTASKGTETENSQNNKTSTPKSNRNNNSSSSFFSSFTSDSSKRKVSTLEAALIDSKISAALAKQSVCELLAKLYVIHKRISRLSSDISLEEQKLELVPAIVACEEVLQLFHNPNHIFRVNPLQTAQFVLAFAAVFTEIAEYCLIIIPSYRMALTKEMSLLHETVEIYKRECLQARVKGLRLKAEQPQTMLDAVGKMEWNKYVLEDSYASFKTCLEFEEEGNGEDANENLAEPVRVYNSANEGYDVYKNDLERVYEEKFEKSLEGVGKFSGFRNDVDVDTGTGADDDSSNADENQDEVEVEVEVETETNPDFDVAKNDYDNLVSIIGSSNTDDYEEAQVKSDVSMKEKDCNNENEKEEEEEVDVDGVSD